MMLDYPYLQILGNLVITFIAVLVSVNVLAMFLPLGIFFFMVVGVIMLSMISYLSLYLHIGKY